MSINSSCQQPSSSFFLIRLVLALVISSENAYAYVDPGIIDVMYQLIYAVVFGVIFIFLARPNGFIKNFVKRFYGSDKQQPSVKSQEKE